MGGVNLMNSSSDPIILYKNDQVCQIRTCKTVNESASTQTPKLSIPQVFPVKNYSSNVTVDPSKQLSESCC